MKETERFIRFLLPGSIFITALLLPVLLAHRNFPILFTNQFTTIFTGLLLITSIGYLSSWIYWLVYNYFEFGPSHKITIQQLLTNKSIIVVKGNRPIEINELSTDDCWAIINILWYLPKNEKSNFSTISPIVDRYADILHGFGICSVAIILGSVSSIFMSGTLCHCNESIQFFILGISINVIFLITSIINFYNLKAKYEKLINSSILSNFNTLNDHSIPLRIEIA